MHTTGRVHQQHDNATVPGMDNHLQGYASQEDEESPGASTQLQYIVSSVSVTSSYQDCALILYQPEVNLKSLPDLVGTIYNSFIHLKQISILLTPLGDYVRFLVLLGIQDNPQIVNHPLRGEQSQGLC